MTCHPWTKIGNHAVEQGAFEGFTGLTSITIPDSVTEIGYHAFSGCTGLTSITIPDSVTKLSGFHGCTGLTSIVIPDSVTEIGESAFSGCTGLTSIVIPDSVTEIGNWAFDGCTGLTSVTIGNSVTEIDEAFRGCNGIKTATVLAPLKKLDLEDSKLLETLTLGTGIKKLVIDGTALKVINVPAKKADYYKKRLPEPLHSLIVELTVEKKAKKE